MFFSAIVTGTLLLFHGATVNAQNGSWPYAPFRTEGRYMKDSRGQNIVYAGINWPGHADVMIPEGLQYQSIATIVTKVKSLNMNSIRLTYAIQMIDDILKEGDVTLEDSLNRALGSTKGPTILAKILKNNPSFTGKTTRLQVSPTELYVEKHVSKVNLS